LVVAVAVVFVDVPKVPLGVMLCGLAVVGDLDGVDLVCGERNLVGSESNFVSGGLAVAGLALDDVGDDNRSF